jgi:hypothetical protein
VSNTNKTSPRTRDLVARGLAKRYRAEKRFRLYGLISVVIGVAALVVLFWEIFSSGLGGFQQTYIRLPVNFDPKILEITDARDSQQVRDGNYEGVVRAALAERFPDVRDRVGRRDLNGMLSIGAAFDLRDKLAAAPELLGQGKTYWLLADDDVDTYYKSLHSGRPFVARTSESRQGWIQDLIDSGDLRRQFNTRLFTSGDSSEPEMAGILGAVVGSLLTLLVTFLLSFPIGVAAAIYLEEYAPRNRFTDFIEVNISNLAAVPSIIFGLLGLAIFGGRFGVNADDAAHHHYFQPQRHQGGAAQHSRSGPGHRRLQNADDSPSCTAAGHARHAHGRHHRHGSGAGRNRAPADDRYGGLHHGCAQWHFRPGDSLAGADFSLVRQPRAGVCRADLRCYHGAARVPRLYEHAGSLAAQTSGASLVAGARNEVVTCKQYSSKNPRSHPR